MNQLLAKISSRYQLEVKIEEKVSGGFLSENYILSDGATKYFLKKYRFDNQERIEEIHRVKKYFLDNGIPVIFPIATQDGDTFFLFENAYYTLFPFVKDKQLSQKQLSEKATKSLGEVLGKIHLLGKVAVVENSDKFSCWNKEKSLEKIRKIEAEIDKKSELSDFDKLALESLSLKKKLILENSLTYEDLNLPSDHLIHGDYLYHNVFFGNNDSVSFVFDFEKTDYSPRTYELFRSMFYSFLGEDITQASLDKAKLYLSSYLKFYPMSQDEIRKGFKLFYLKSIHGFWVESEHYLKNNSRTDVLLDAGLKRIKYLVENFDFLEEMFVHTNLD